MGCVAALPFLVLLGSFFALAQDGVTISDYVRPPASSLLPLEHERLARAPTASPHVPEQVHLTLAGSGAMAVSWLTYPQVVYFFIIDVEFSRESILIGWTEFYGLQLSLLCLRG